MIRPQKYLRVGSQSFCSPLIKENLRLDFDSADYKLDDLSLLAVAMLRDCKTLDDMVAVTNLPPSVMENVLDMLKSQGIIDERNIHNLPEQTKKILKLSDCINSFNVNTPPIFSDILTKKPVILPRTAALKKSGDDTTCAAFVKNCKQISVTDYESLSTFVKNFLREHGAENILDELQVLRLDQRAEISFAARELRLLPVVGENNFDGCVELNSTQTINAELPVRKFTAEDGRELNVDLVLGTTFAAPDEDDDSEEPVLSFKPNPKLTGDGAGIRYVKISVSAEVAGDFLCE